MLMSTCPRSTDLCYCTTPVTFNALFSPFPVVAVSELTVLLSKKEVCRLEISGGQLLFSSGPEHFSNLVNVC